MTPLAELVAAELAEPVDVRVREMAVAIAAKHGAASRAVLFYGSCLRERQLDGLMLDFYLIVSNYAQAYDKRWLATANRLIPPNVFPFAHENLAAKYAVLSEADFAALNRPEASTVSVWARFAQPTRMVWAADDEACRAAIAAVAQAAPTLLSLSSPLTESNDPLDAWRVGFINTYACELRAERNARPGAIVDAAADRYHAFTEAVLLPRRQIDDVLRAAAKPGHNHAVAKVAPVAPWLAEEATRYGLSIAGMTHTIDTSAVRHVIKRHGDERLETSRGQLAVAAKHIRSAAKVLAGPDLVAMGAIGKRRQPVIAYSKLMPDGTTVYIEEVMGARKQLALLTMRRFPGTIDASRFRATLNLNARSASREEIYIIEMPNKIKNAQYHGLEVDSQLSRHVAERRWRRLRRNGKAMSVARLAKASFTFAGGIDYLAWKISRHSGAEIAIKPWQRRWPLLGAVVLVPRLLMKGAIR